MNAETKLRDEIKKSGLKRKQWYRRIYLKSDHWKNLKIKFFFSIGVKQCSRCKAIKRIDVHHINYKSIYDVLLTDLEALCRTCHKQEHKKKIERVPKTNKNNETRKEYIQRRRSTRKTVSVKRLIKKLQHICRTRLK